MLFRGGWVGERETVVESEPVRADVSEWETGKPRGKY